jgi:biopolymer transport protein ExbD
MPKAKIARKSTAIDMTAMCDVAFLLLTFFMLTARFKPQDPVVIDTPSSVSDKKLEDANVVTLLLDNTGKLLFNIDNPETRKALITEINTEKQLGLTDAEMTSYSFGSSCGIPFEQMKAFLGKRLDEQKQVKYPGIPLDTAKLSPKNQLITWLGAVRKVNPKASLVIKADGSAKYPQYNAVIKTLADLKILQFKLVTDLEANPNKKIGE